MSEEKRFGITEPVQLKCGGFLCRVSTEDQQTILFETFQATKRWAFTECAFWLIDYNELQKIQPTIEEKKPDA